MRVRSVGTKIFLGMIAVLMVSLISLPVAIKVVNAFGKEEINADLHRGIIALRRYVDLRYQLLGNKVRSIADVPFLKATMEIPDLDAETAEFTIQRLSEVAGAPLVFLLDAQGNFVAAGRSDGGAHGIEQIKVPERVLQGGDYNGVLDCAGTAALVSAVAVKVDDAIIGVVGLAEPIGEDFAQDVSSLSGKDVLIRCGANILGEVGTSASLSGDFASNGELQSVFEHGVGVLGAHATLDGEERILVIDEIKGSNVSIALSRPARALVAAHRQMQISLISCAGLTSVMALLISRYVSRRIAGPIRALTESTREIAKGHGETEEAATSSDEVETLGRSVQSMARRLLEQKESELAASRRESMALCKARDAAEAANKAKTEFIANISHELRTPLHGVLSFAQLGSMKTRGDDSRIPEYFRRIESSGGDLMRLLNELLDLARLESGHVSVNQKAILVDGLLIDVVEGFAALSSQKNVKLVHETSQAPCIAFVDPDRTKQVLRNLIGNALKFSPEGAAITVSAQHHEDSARIMVRDEGPGIPDGELESVFEKFVQSSTTNTGAGGTGLGLAICREILDAQGGRIWAENRERGGATFTFEVPLHLKGSVV